MTCAIRRTLLCGCANAGVQCHAETKQPDLRPCMLRVRASSPADNEINMSAFGFLQPNAGNPQKWTDSELARSWLSSFFFLHRVKTLQKKSRYNNFGTLSKSAPGRQRGGCLPSPSRDPPSALWQPPKHLAQLVYLDSISSPLTSEQLPLNARSANISFKGTSKCVAGAGRRWLTSRQRGSNIIFKGACRASGRRFVFINYAFKTKIKFQTDIIQCHTASPICH